MSRSQPRKRLLPLVAVSALLAAVAVFFIYQDDWRRRLGPNRDSVDHVAVAVADAPLPSPTRFGAYWIPAKPRPEGPLPGRSPESKPLSEGYRFTTDWVTRATDLWWEVLEPLAGRENH